MPSGDDHDLDDEIFDHLTDDIMDEIFEAGADGRAEMKRRIAEAEASGLVGGYLPMPGMTLAPPEDVEHHAVVAPVMVETVKALRAERRDGHLTYEEKSHLRAAEEWLRSLLLSRSMTDRRSAREFLAAAADDLTTQPEADLVRLTTPERT